MPKRPQGQRRPADVIGAAVKVVRIAVGEETKYAPVDDGKDPAAKAMGKKGGAVRAKSLTAEKCWKLARKGAAKRWGRVRYLRPRLRLADIPAGASIDLRISGGDDRTFP